jgi:cyanate lyase
LTKNATGFSDEERRIRIRKAEMGLRVKDIAEGIGILPVDVTMVIRVRSKSPRYITEVYKYLGLDEPK